MVDHPQLTAIWQMVRRQWGSVVVRLLIDIARRQFRKAALPKARRNRLEAGRLPTIPQDPLRHQTKHYLIRTHFHLTRLHSVQA